jgi:hypothetical protein
MLMSDPAILFVKPKAISQRDKKMLQGAGILIVEVDDPGSVKFTRANAEISSGSMLAIACKVIHSQSGPTTRENFAKAICDAIMNPPTDTGSVT